MGTLRIVAGRLRGRRLRVPSDPSLRPTSDRVREALSRGARRVVFVEANPKTAVALRRAAEELSLGSEARIIVGRVEDVLSRARLGGPYHVIVADPPYEATAESRLVDGVDAGQLLGMHGTLVVERESRNPAESGRSGLGLVRTATYGRTALDFFKYL